MKNEQQYESRKKQERLREMKTFTKALEQFENRIIIHAKMFLKIFCTIPNE